MSEPTTHGTSAAGLRGSGARVGGASALRAGRRRVLRAAVGLGALGLGALAAGACVAPAADKRSTGELSAALGAALDGSWPELRCCFLGETDHFAAGRDALVLAGLDALFARGHGRLVIEMGRHDARHLDRFLRAGDPRDLERPALWSLAESAPAGYAGAAFARDRRRFWARVRELAAGHVAGGRLQAAALGVVGYDLEQAPRAALEHARVLAGEPGAAPGRAAFEASIGALLRPATQSLAEQAERAEAVASQVRARLGPADSLAATLADAERALRHQRDLAAAGGDPRAQTDVQRRREADLTRNLLAAFAADASAPRNAPVPRSVVLGHAFHLTRSDADLFWGAPGNDLPAGPRAGSALFRELGARGASTAVLWLLFAGGERLAPGRAPATIVPAADALERLPAAQRAGPLVELDRFPGDRRFTANGRPAHGELSALADLALLAP